MFCKNCGQQIDDKAVICVHCGCSTGAKEQQQQAADSSTLQIIVKIFMVLGCIATGWWLIPLIWTIPMTVHYFRATKEGRPVGVGFKICTLLFVSLIGGILMFFDNGNN